MARLFYTDHHALPLPDGHKFPAGKYRMLREILANDGLYQFEPAPPAEVTTIELAHDPTYVRGLVTGTLAPATMRRIGIPWSEILVQRALASVGGTLGAAQDALANGWGGTLGGGTHHAFRDAGAGFCVFNDIAVAIQFLRHRSVIQRAAIIDLDVHQGDGTAEIFRDDPSVFTLSIHGHNNFPFRKKQSTLDIALPDHTGDDDYLRALDDALPHALAFQPDIIFYQSGVDGLKSDILGRLSLTPEGLIERDRKVMFLARSYGCPFVLTSGGGYSRPIELSAQAHANTYRVAWEVFCREHQPLSKSKSISQAAER